MALLGRDFSSLSSVYWFALRLLIAQIVFYFSFLVARDSEDANWSRLVKLGDEDHEHCNGENRVVFPQLYRIGTFPCPIFKTSFWNQTICWWHDAWDWITDGGGESCSSLKTANSLVDYMLGFFSFSCITYLSIFVIGCSVGKGEMHTSLPSLAHPCIL